MWKKFLSVITIIIIVVGLYSICDAVNYEEVYNNTFVRSTGSPVIETIALNLSSAGTLTIKNGSLEDDITELSSSTEVYLDGVQILNPFHIEAGMAYLKDLTEGSHSIELALYGKPGGQVNVTVMEESSCGPIPYVIRYEFLEDETVRDNKTGLIWHRFPNTPGIIHGSSDTPLHASDMNDYINNLNNGVYGTDSINGNAGYTDWRIPTIEEMITVFSNQPGINLSNKYDDGPHVYTDPFMICNWYNENCPDEHRIYDAWLTQSNCFADPGGWFDCDHPNQVIGVDSALGFRINEWHSGGDVWPVRGPN